MAEMSFPVAEELGRKPCEDDIFPEDS